MLKFVKVTCLDVERHNFECTISKNFTYNLAKFMLELAQMSTSHVTHQYSVYPML